MEGDDGSILKANRKSSVNKISKTGKVMKGRPPKIIAHSAGEARHITERKRVEVELLKLRKAVVASGEVIFMADRDGLFTFVNPEFTRLYGYTAAEVVGKTTPRILKSGVMKPEDYGIFWQTLLNKQVVKRELINKTKDGRFVTVGISVNPILDDGQNITGFLAIQRDITESKKKDQRLRIQYAVTSILMEAETFDDAIQRIFKVICDGLGWKRGEFWSTVLDSDTKTNSLRCTQSYSSPSTAFQEFEKITRSMTFQIGVGLPGRVWASGRPLWIEDVTKDKLFPRAPIAAKEGIHMGIGFPVMVEKEVMGVMEFFDDNISKPDDNLLQTFESIGAQIGQYYKRKRAEEALEKSAEEYRNLIDTMNEGLAVQDKDGMLVFINKQACGMLGYAPEEVIGKPVMIFFDEENQKILREQMARRRKGEYQRYEITWTCKDGGKVHTIMAPRPLFDEQGNFKGSVAVFTDITERKRVEEALKVSEEYATNIIESSLDMIIAVDKDRIIIQLNKAAQETFGYRPEEILGKHVDTLYANPEIGLKVHKTTIEKGRCVQEIVNKRKNGEVFPSLLASSILKDSRNRTIGVMGVSRDISERKRTEEAIAQQGIKYETMLSTITEGFWLVDEQGRLLDVNDAYCSMSGYSKEELLQFSIQDLETAESPEETARHIQAIMEKGTDRFESKHRSKDGRVYDVEISTAFWLEKKRFFVFIQDISNRKRVEEALRENEKILRESQSIAGLGSYVMDIPTGIWKSSKVLDKIFGIDETFTRSVEGWASLIHPDGREPLLNYFQDEVLAKHARFDKEYKIIRKEDGEERWVQGIGELEFDSQNKPTKMIGSILDITERKLAESELKESEGKYRSLVNNINDGFFIADLEGNITFANEALARIQGYKSKDDIIGKHFSDFIPPGLQDKMMAQRRRSFETGKMETLEVPIIKADGTTGFIELKPSPLLEGDKIIGDMGVIRDVTERKKLEEQMRQVQKMESIGTLAGGIAHDFNNILGIIMAYSSLLQHGKLGAKELPDTVGTILKATERGAALVKQILTFARKTDVSVGAVQVNYMIKELISMLHRTFPKTIEFDVELSKSLPIISIDAGQLNQTLMNLCVNARDAIMEANPAGKSQGRIAIRTTTLSGRELSKKFPEASAGEYVEVSISDTGKGMDEQTKQRAFEPFFTTKEKGKGTGLGLAVVYGVVQNHSGFIDLQTELGRGTRFSLYFPVPKEGAFKARVDGNERLEVLGGDETILVVEDEEALRNLLENVLKAKGYTVLTAVNGLKAVEVFARNKDTIHLVLSDQGLPKLSGSEAFIRMKQVNPKVKAILASGFIEPNQKSEIFKSGVKEFIQKPYDPDEVLRRVRQVLDIKEETLS